MLVHRVCETVRQCRRRCTRLACLEIRENLILLFANYKQSGENLLEIGIITASHAFRTSAHTLCIPVDRVKKRKMPGENRGLRGRKFVCACVTFVTLDVSAQQLKPTRGTHESWCCATRPALHLATAVSQDLRHKKSNCLLDKPCENRKKAEK